MAKSIPLSETPDSVKIMTVHKSKGLEFPVVIYSFAHEIGEGGGRDRQLIWVKDVNNWFEGLPVLLMQMKKDMENTPYARILADEIKAKFQDSVNLAYVAMTRAVQRLYVISAPRDIKSTNMERHFWGILQKFVLQNDLFSSCDDVRFQYGIKKEELKKTDWAGAEQAFRLGLWKSYDWKTRVGIRPGRLPAESGEAKKRAIDRGTLIHAILSRVSTIDDLPVMVEQVYDEGWLTLDEADEFQLLLSGLLEMDEVLPFFHPDHSHRREAAIITPDGRKYRPDRVVKTDEGMKVLDFKTGDPHPWHHSQVQEYVLLLEEMGYENVRGYLLYIDQGLLVEA